MGLIPRRSPGEGHGNPLQCSCLENPRDGGAWWAAVYGVAQSWTRLSDLAAAAATKILVDRVTGKFGLRIWTEAGQRLIEFAKRTRTHWS